VQLEQGTVTSLLEEKGTIKGVQYKTKTGQEMTAYAPLTIVCDGCFSNLRRSLCNPKVRFRWLPCKITESRKTFFFFPFGNPEELLFLNFG
jgi:2-polyprenyl-6-methoxyphenol hydroxylase-like FAD-dependent oxidoreductase